MIALADATAILAAGLAWRAGLKAHVAGDAPEDHEDNSFGLPEGAPLRKRLRSFFAKQQQEIAGFMAKLGAEIPDRFPSLADYDDPMASAMTPILGLYWDKAGKGLRGRLGLDPADWRVTDPNLHKSIAAASLRFCRKTNETTDLALDAALAAVREQLRQGLVEEGDSVSQLAKRVQRVFVYATKERATRIARTEAARAVHAAAEESARLSGVVAGKKWLASANSCPLCLRLEGESVKLGAAFAKVGNDPEYSIVRTPPAHPHCRCSLLMVPTDPASDPVMAFDPKPGTASGKGTAAAPREDIPTFGPSKAGVKRADDPATPAQLRAERRTIERLTGLKGEAAVEFLASLAGATDRSAVTYDVAGPEVMLYVGGDRFESVRTVRKDSRGKRYVYNDSFFVDNDAQGGGIGANVFGRQVEQASKAGFAYLKTQAARGRTMNGYYTWARFGYDATIPDEVRRTIPREFLSAKRISDLMATPEGREAWKKYGVTTDMKFDLAPGSASRRVWEDYLAEKARKNPERFPAMPDPEAKPGDPTPTKSLPAPAEPRGEFPDFDDEDDEILDRVWDRIAAEKAGNDD